MTLSFSEVLNDIELSVFGDHNLLNATATYIVGLEIGLTKEQIKNGLREFKGFEEALGICRDTFIRCEII